MKNLLNLSYNLYDNLRFNSNFSTYKDDLLQFLVELLFNLYLYKKI